MIYDLRFMNKTEIVERETRELLGKLGIEAEAAVETEGEVFKIQIKADRDAPILIGRYGETLIAFKRILETIIFKQCGEKTNLMVNVNDYREKQVERLEQIAENAVVRVKTEDKSVFLSSLSSYERKIVHEYVSRAYPDLTSYSEGEDDERTLVIAMKKEE